MSSASLPASTRLPNGSGLRNELRKSPGPDAPRSLLVLQNILGAPPRGVQAAGASSTVLVPPEELVEFVEFGTMSLQAFANEEGQVSVPAVDVHSYSTLSIEEFEKEKEKFEDLHKSISACDQVLLSVETYLTGFQSDLGAVSAEIETLQSRSTALNARLENRKVVEKLLGPSVEDLSLSPAVVRKIAEGSIDEAWIRALAELEKRSKVIENKQKDSQKLKALDDVTPLMDNMKNKALARIRDHFVAQIKALRSPNINAQIIQQESFVKYKDLFAFLARNQRQLAEEISKAYINTMRWYYLTHFTRYESALKLLKLHAVDKNDVLGQMEDLAARRATRGPSVAYDVFSIGRRMNLLKASLLPAISSYLAEEDKSVHYVETSFRSFNLTLIDNASFEYAFISNFFSPILSFHAIARTFDAIFVPTFTLGQSLTKSLVETSVDALGILLCVRLNQHFAFELQRRKVPALEGYINATNMLLWPRFQQVMDMHCESLRKALPATTGRAALLTGSASITPSIAPHPLTQRFASFLQGVLAMSSEAGDDEPVANSLGRLRVDFEAFLTRLSKSLSDPRKRERFLFNNYSLVVTILENAEGRLAEENRKHFQELKDAYTGDEK